MTCFYEIFEDTNGLIRHRKLKKDRKYNSKAKKKQQQKTTNNVRWNTTLKTKGYASLLTPLKTADELRPPGEESSSRYTIDTRDVA